MYLAQSLCFFAIIIGVEDLNQIITPKIARVRGNIYQAQAANAYCCLARKAGRAADAQTAQQPTALRAAVDVTNEPVRL